LWYDELQGDPTRLYLVIESLEPREPVGMVGLNGINPTYGEAELFIYIGEKRSWRVGLGENAVAQLLKIAFETMGLHRIYAYVFDYNTVARSFFERMGFREEGCLRESCFKKGRYWDKRVFGMIASEFSGSEYASVELSEQKRYTGDEDDDLESSILAANISFHSELATLGVYKDQPFLQENNRGRIRDIIGGILAGRDAPIVLDVGTGTGLIPGIASELAARVVGIDITPAMLREAPRLDNVRYLKAQGERVPFRGGSFDLVSAYGVIHHLADLKPFFAEVFRCLKPGGCFYADESPSAKCRNALLNMDLAKVSDDAIRNAVLAVKNEFEEYERRYGFSSHLALAAMHQNSTKGGIVIEELEKILLSCGFKTVAVTPRWFVGQRFIAEDKVNTIDEYLRSAFPLSDGLYKYFSLVAQK